LNNLIKETGSWYPTEKQIAVTGMDPVSRRCFAALILSRIIYWYGVEEKQVENCRRK
jgi:hypothetical protein